MTINEAIKRIKEHMVIHKMNEPQAIFISEALCMGINALEKLKWKSVKDELPKDGREVLVKLNYTADYEEKYKFAGYSIARYLKFDDGCYWCDNQYGYLEWDKYSDGHGGSSWYKVVEWKEI